MHILDVHDALRGRPTDLDCSESLHRWHTNICYLGLEQVGVWCDTQKNENYTEYIQQ